MTFLLDERIESVTTGDLIYIPNGTVYSARVDSEDARFLNLHTTSGYDEVVEYLSRPNEANDAEPWLDYKGKQIDGGPYARLLQKIGLKYLQVPNPLRSV